MIPDFYCPTCKVLLCESCHDDSKGGHNKKTHKVKSIDDIDIEKISKELGCLSLKNNQTTTKKKKEEEEEN